MNIFCVFRRSKNTNFIKFTFYQKCIHFCIFSSVFSNSILIYANKNVNKPGLCKNMQINMNYANKAQICTKILQGVPAKFTKCDWGNKIGPGEVGRGNRAVKFLGRLAKIHDLHIAKKMVSVLTRAMSMDSNRLELPLWLRVNIRKLLCPN